MKKFACNFDAIEIEAHNIIQQDDGQITYEPADFGPSIPPDVWSVFGHIPIVDDGYPGHGGSRKLIADCETPEAAEFIAQLVRMHIINGYYRNEGAVPDVPVYWYTDRPGCCEHPERAICTEEKPKDWIPPAQETCGCDVCAEWRRIRTWK